jgi:hypothetical protein
MQNPSTQYINRPSKEMGPSTEKKGKSVMYVPNLKVRAAVAVTAVGRRAKVRETGSSQYFKGTVVLIALDASLGLLEHMFRFHAVSFEHGGVDGGLGGATLLYRELRIKTLVSTCLPIHPG